VGVTRHLLLLNGVAVLGAVINHALGWGFTSLFWWTDRYEPVSVPNFSQLGGPVYYLLRVLEQLVTFSVPAFLFVSGFFVAFAAGRVMQRLPWDKVRSRIRMLLIPYVVWSLAIFAARGLEGATDTSAGSLAQWLMFGRAADPYYYVPVIVQLYLLSPLLIAALRLSWKPVLIAAAVVQVSVHLARYPVILGWDSPAATWIYSHAPSWFFPHVMFWFVFGAFAGFHPAPVREWLTRWGRWLAPASVVLGVAALVEWEVLLRLSGQQWLRPQVTLVDGLYSFACILTFMALVQSRTATAPQLDALGARSFGVYLLHAPVLELFSRASYHLTPVLLGHQVAFMALLIAAGVAVPLLLMAIAARTPARPYYNYLFG
jgi:peptidoglycan/LPS O-acetylase OafA/YrhL